MKLTTYNPYTPSQQIAIKAMEGKKINELKKSEYIDSIKEAVINGLICIGQKQDSTQIKTLTDCLVHELHSTKSAFTVEEIRIAIDYGAKGKLCELNSLPQPIISLHNILKFIKLYNENIRREAIHAMNEEADKKEKEITEAERKIKIEAFEAEIEKALMLSLKEKESLPIGLKAAYYRHLDKQGKVNLSNEEKNIIWKRAGDLMPEIEKNRNPFLDCAYESKKREALQKEIAESLAFEII